MDTQEGITFGGGIVREKRRKSDEQWFKETVRVLKQYRTWQTRIKVLEIRREEATPNCIANYCLAAGGGGIGDQTGSMGTNRATWEKEIEEKQNSLEEIDTALLALSDEEKRLIEMRYIYDVRDWHIYELKMPMGKRQYYEKRDGAIEKIAQCLGFVEC